MLGPSLCMKKNESIPGYVIPRHTCRFYCCNNCVCLVCSCVYLSFRFPSIFSSAFVFWMPIHTRIQSVEGGGGGGGGAGGSSDHPWKITKL